MTEFIIISGLSGAGKSQAANVLEDLGCYCVDNMPVELIPKFAQLAMSAHGRYDRVVLVTDVREKQSTQEILTALDEITQTGCRCRVLFIEADTRVIVKRYKETRRRHPLSQGGSIEDAIERESRLMEPIRKRAQHVVDTSRYTLADLQSELYRIFTGGGVSRKLLVNFLSFGFKYGIPLEADLVFDVRFLPNPYYIEELRGLTGEDKPVYDYVMASSTAREFIAKVEELLTFLLPHYSEEGKYSLTVAIGCTGGRHRSVAIARKLSAYVESLGHKVSYTNRESFASE